MAVFQDKAGSDDFKTLLRDIFYSGELKIDSQFAENLKVKMTSYAVIKYQKS